LNVRDADATLLLIRGAPTGGTALTLAIAMELDRPWHIGDPFDPRAALAPARVWLERIRPRALNVAGSRESQCPGIGAAATHFLDRLLRGLTT
jgi:hypothetical protein